MAESSGSLHRGHRFAPRHGPSWGSVVLFSQSVAVARGSRGRAGGRGFRTTYYAAVKAKYGIQVGEGMIFYEIQARAAQDERINIQRSCHSVDQRVPVDACQLKEKRTRAPYGWSIDHGDSDLVILIIMRLDV